MAAPLQCALAAICALGVMTGSALQAQTIFDRNLVVNGDAESGPGW